MSERKKELAALIMTMTYGELKGVASDFSQMIDPKVRQKIATEAEFMDLLFDWAEATA